MFDYVETLKKLKNSENTYGTEIGNLNNTINDERIRTNELRNKIQYLEDAENDYFKTMGELNIELSKLKNKKKFKGW